MCLVNWREYNLDRYPPGPICRTIHKTAESARKCMAHIPGPNFIGYKPELMADDWHCTVPLSLFADPERILRRLYVFAEEPCKSTTATSELCSPVFKEVQPRPSEHSNLEYHINNLNLYLYVFGLFIFFVKKVYPTLANSTPIRNSNTRSDQPGVHFIANPAQHIYATTSDRGDQYKPPKNDSILQGTTSSPVDQFTINTTDVAGHNELWRCNNATSTSSNTIKDRTATIPTGHNRLQNDNLPSPPDLRNGPTCFRCGEQGHMRAECRERVFCNHCRSYNHDTKACRKQHNNIPSPAHSQIARGYHPTATPPPLMGTTMATQPTGMHNNPLFNLLDNNQPRTSTIMHTLHNGTSPAMPADLVEGIIQIMNQVTSNNKRDDASKKMMKNIKIFDGSNMTECITWLSQVEAAAKFTNTPFQELICQSKAPTMLHIFSDLSALASNADIKEAILTNYSDIPSTTEAAT